MVVSFTGHRPKDLYGYYNDTAYKAVVQKIKDYLKHLDSRLTVITGGAQGIDQLAFWAATYLKREGYDVTTVVAVPFKGQELRWVRDGHFGQTEYNLMLKLADEVVYLSDNSNNAIQKLDDRNHWMVDHSDLLCCVTPHDDIATRKGGTGNCLRYAIKNKHPYFILKI